MPNAPTSKPKAWLSWSSGKDSAWTLHLLRTRDDVEVVGLLTTLNGNAGRVAMHAVREELLDAQAEAAGLPLIKVVLPGHPCSNEQYEEAMRAAIARAQAEGITRMAFGDLYLEDVRRYRERMLAGTGIQPLFPLWGQPTEQLANRMIAAGLRAYLTCVDPKQLAPTFVGRTFDEWLLEDLPAGVDPCGERGEFHTFAYAGPMFSESIPIVPGEIVTRDGFVFADLQLDQRSTNSPPGSSR
ncbi:MAG: ATP-binding protein [Nitrospiraceae bacterium]